MGWFGGDKKADKPSPLDMKGTEKKRRAIEDSKIKTAELQAELDLDKNGSAWDKFWKAWDI